MMKSKSTLEGILFEKGKINKEQLEQLQAAKKEKDTDTEKLIITNRWATEKEIAETISEALDIPFIDLSRYIIDPAAINAVNKDVAHRLKVLPLYAVKDVLTVAMADPLDPLARDDLKVSSSYKKIQIVTAIRSAVMNGIEQYYIHGRSLDDIIEPMEAQGMDFMATSGVTPKTLASLAGQPPVVKFVNQMIFEALKLDASDIHIEPLPDTVRVRYRVDGILQTAASIPRSIHLPIVPRIKILSELDIAERRKPQDGRFTVTMAGKQIDLRVSTFPTAYGESVALRILDKSTALLGISELGLRHDELKTFQKMIKNPYGILIVSGPTGCGKTTTLYAVLNEIRSPKKNLLTIEDPIEYLLEDVTQTQINAKIGLTFASALRSLLRQDPDTIMLGEIRDSETAEMAFRAALTGHLVLSTLHTNDAPTSLTRLRDLGVDKNMISSSMTGVLAQRLVRVICKSCKQECEADKILLKDLKFKPEAKTKFHKGAGCPECNSTGYKGRLGIFELLEFTEDIELLTRSDASADEIRKAAIKNGMVTLKENGLRKVEDGITTIEEVARVTQT